MDLKSIYQNVLDGQVDEVLSGVKAALAAGVAPNSILNEALIAAMSEVGRLFEEGEYFVPDMLISARAMQAGLEILKPKLVAAGVEPIGKVVLGTVKGDLHDIGKNLVGMMLGGAGFEVVDLGVDVAPEKFVAALGPDVDLLGLSALLTTTMPGLENTIQAVKTANLSYKVKIMVGGAPVTADYAQKIGADGFAKDAGQAVTVAKSLLES